MLTDYTVAAVFLIAQSRSPFCSAPSLGPLQTHRSKVPDSSVPSIHLCWMTAPSTVIYCPWWNFQGWQLNLSPSWAKNSVCSEEYHWVLWRKGERSLSQTFALWTHSLTSKEQSQLIDFFRAKKLTLEGNFSARQTLWRLNCCWITTTYLML